MTKPIVEKTKNQLTFILDTIIEDPSIPQEKKVKLIINTTSLICAIVAAQPIPFADILILSPIQLIMVTYLNKAIGNPYEKSKLNELLTSLVGVVGWGLLAQQLILGAYKTIIPFLGGFTTIPLVYAATFALGNGAKTLIEAKKNDKTISNEEIERIVKQAKKEAKKEKGSLSLNSIKNDINELNENAKKFEQYKKQLAYYEEVLKELGIYNTDISKEDIINNADISKVYNNRRRMIEERFVDKYKNLIFSEQVLDLMALLPPKILLEEVEQNIGLLNFNNSKLKTKQPFEDSSAREIETNFGVIYVLIRFKCIYVQYIEFNESIQAQTFFVEYFKINNEVNNNKILKDQEIGDAFRNTFKVAQKEIECYQSLGKLCSPKLIKARDSKCTRSWSNNKNFIWNW